MVLRSIALRALALTVSTGAAWAQGQNTSSKTRPESNENAQGNVLGQKPDKVLHIEKVKGVIKSVDLQRRLITVDHKGQALELAFAQPNGREQIKTSKKIFKETGDKKLNLEDLKPGAKVQLQYYTALGQMLELVVESMS